mmetsp:Transcript_33647/g.60182  ORF Transcript_33647/g.60182 Transcript_33647/m.60182 type:complete len:544 (-) Transcript_33647:1839-3470(-)
MGGLRQRLLRAFAAGRRQGLSPLRFGAEPASAMGTWAYSAAPVIAVPGKRRAYWAAAPGVRRRGGCWTTTRSFASSGAEAVEVEEAPAGDLASSEAEEPQLESLTPTAVVKLLDKYIIGQQDAKKAVAVALRNRWRRMRIPGDLRSEVVPKNILMIGPTGCGKTEIARRLAKLADAPFVKVEATKFTEVGFHGRDVDQIIRDLVENAIVHARARMKRKIAKKVEAAVEEKLLELLVGTEGEVGDKTKESFRDLLREGQLESRRVEYEPPTPSRVPPSLDLSGGAQEIQVAFARALGGGPKREGKKKLKVSEARPLIEEAEAERLINNENLVKEAIANVEADGIVFIDEIDKIVVSGEQRYGADASNEGVQRDLLPIIEGSTVTTKHGNVETDFILFICSGAFHSCKPSDMMAELQGRLPIRVELKGLSSKDFYRILTEPENSMVKQQVALLATEGVTLEFTDAAVKEVSRVAEEVNRSVDNIGARRLHTILERILEDISFNAPEIAAEAKANGTEAKRVIDLEDVQKSVGPLMTRTDLSKYVL